MHPSPCNLEQLAERLARLERQNRWLRLAVLGLLVLGGVTLLAAAQTDKAQSTDANNFVLRDAAGKIRARMEVGKDGPMLQFLDENGRGIASLGAYQSAVQLRLLNREGRMQTGLALQPEGIAMLAYTRDGQPHSGPNAIMVTTGILSPP